MSYRITQTGFQEAHVSRSGLQKYTDIVAHNNVKMQK